MSEKIIVRIPMIDFLDDLESVEEQLTAGGITPEKRMSGVVRRWVDFGQDVAVFEWIPPEDLIN